MPQSPGAWARKVTPSWCYTVQETALRLGCSRRHVTRLAIRHNVPLGRETRLVKTPSGIYKRGYCVITPSALDRLLAIRAGLG